MCMDAQVPCSPWKDENGLSLRHRRSEFCDKNAKFRAFECLIYMAGGRGFEPLLAESESNNIVLSIGFNLFHNIPPRT